MNCPQCRKYIPLNYSSCPNCRYEPSPDEWDSGKAEEVGQEDAQEVEFETIEPEVIDIDVNIPQKNDAKKCPYCAESIKLEAVICRFCMMNLRTGKLIVSENRSGDEALHFIKYGCGIIIALPFLMLLFFMLLMRGCTTF